MLILVISDSDDDGVIAGDGESTVEEATDDLVLRDGRVAVRLEEVERVPLLRRLPYLRLAAPPARREPVVVGAAAVAEHVALADAHEHAVARQRVERRRAVHERVDERVVLARGGRAHDAPQAPEALAHGGVQVVGGHPVSAEEVGVDHDEAPDLGAVGEPLLGHPHRYVVRDVGAGALAAEVEAGEVGVVDEPRLVAIPRGVSGDPRERLPRVRVGRRDGVLRREAVLDGDDEGVGERGEGVEVGVERGVEGRAEAEPAAVVVDEHGELGLGGGGVVEAGEVEARGDVGGDDAVVGGDAGGGVGGRGDELGAEVALHAVLVDADAGHRLVHDLVVGRRRRRRGGCGVHGAVEIWRRDGGGCRVGDRGENARGGARVRLWVSSSVYTKSTSSCQVAVQIFQLMGLLLLKTILK
jgi:hypothetical protein